MNKSIFLLPVLLLVSGCAAVPFKNPSPLYPYFEKSLSGFKPEEKDEIKKSNLRRHYSYAYDEVWASAVSILQQYALITHISKNDGVISYIDIDGILLGKRIYYWEFPFSVYFEKVEDGVMVYVYPMEKVFSFDNAITSRKWWSDVKKGFQQKGEELLDRVYTQLDIRKRWPWLK